MVTLAFSAPCRCTYILTFILRSAEVRRLGWPERTLEISSPLSVTVHICFAHRNVVCLVVFSGVWRGNPARSRHSVQSQLPGILQAEQGMRLEDHRARRVHGRSQVPVVRGTTRR